MSVMDDRSFAERLGDFIAGVDVWGVATAVIAGGVAALVGRAIWPGVWRAVADGFKSAPRLRRSDFDQRDKR